MVEEVSTVASPITEAAVVPSAPVEVAASASSVESPVVPVAEAPVVESAPIVESPKVEDVKPLLSETEEVKTDAPVDAPKVEAEPAPLPVYEFKLPEGAQAENPQFKAFTTKLGELQNLSKAEQAVVQKFGQEMIDMHIEDVKNIIEKQNKDNWDWYNNRNKEWLETAKKDPQIGGEQFDETVKTATQAISLYGGTKAQQAETAKLFQQTGVENHPALLRFLSNITKVAAKEGTPVQSRNVSIQKPGIAEAMYGQKKAS